MSLSSIAVIPARYGSNRLPGKPLRLLAGKPLVQRVYEAVADTALFQRIIITTDDSRIEEAALSFGAEVLMTSEDCQSGTDRILEIKEQLTADIIVNVQGDEPFITKEPLEKLISSFTDPQVDIASLMMPTADPSVATNPNIVKVVTDINDFALYFSRSQIPFDRDSTTSTSHPFFTHIGVYAFRQNILNSIAKLPLGKLETREKLEQLRWLEHSLKIKMIETDYNGFGIDTEADLLKAETYLSTGTL
ncbi:MAG: 3-deoxy-manno-octulosonate cytidylyltransferase [Candidatus Cloacimonadia bacterium]